MLVGFGLALLLNRTFPLKGFVTTLLLLPMMMSMAVVGLFWKLLYDPSWGPINYVLGLGNFDWLSNPDVALYAVAITDIWMWAPFVMLLVARRALGGAEAPLRGGGDRPRQRLVHLHAASPCRWWRRSCSSRSSSARWRRSRPSTSPSSCRASRPPRLISIRLYKMAFQEWQTGTSCALAYIVLIVVLAITNIYVKYLNR